MPGLSVAHRTRFARPLMGIFVLALVGWACVSFAHAKDDVRTLLQEARTKELVHVDYAGAWRTYDEIIRIGDIDTTVLATALVGAARCAEQTGDRDSARDYWQKILANKELPAFAHEFAQEKTRADAADRPQAPGMSEDEVARRVNEQLANRRRVAEADAARKVQQGRRLLERGQYQAALRLCYEALAIDNDNADARLVLKLVEKARPERGLVLQQILEFLQTRQLEEYQHLKKKVRELQERGRLAYLAGNDMEADRHFRDAINRIDESDFLETGGTLSFNSLSEDRAYLVEWMRATHERGKATGLTFEGEPPRPDLEDRKGGLQAQFYALLAEVFTAREQGTEPLRFYNFGAEDRAQGRDAPLLSSEFVTGQRAALGPSAQSRAEWAERWIREHVGSGWTHPSRPSIRGPGRSGSGTTKESPSHILTRFGNVLGVQHVEGVHRRVEALRRSFGDAPVPMQIDVRVYAASAAGTVQAAELLNLRVTPYQSDRALVADMLIDRLADLLRSAEGIHLIGTAQVRLKGSSTTRLEISHLTDRHPSLAGTPPPPMRVAMDDARYGLWLDLFAQDMPEAAGGQARSALGMSIDVVEPRGSFVVPRATDKEQPWSRVPQFHEHHMRTDLQLPHFGTLVCLGVPNPFPETQTRHPELLLVVGCKPQRMGLPDPPAKGDSRIVPETSRHEEYALGPLSSEVLDHEIVDGWPTTQPARLAPLTERIGRRGRYLGKLISSMAGLTRTGDDPEAPPVLVDNHRATGVLSPEEHARVRTAIERFRDHERDLYRVSVRSTLVTRAQFDGLMVQPDIREIAGGAWLVESTARSRVQRFMGQSRAAASLYSAQNTLLARATQQVALRSLRERAVMRDVYVRGGKADKTQPRYEPVHGAMEEGLVVEVRPGLQRDKTRPVAIRARATRLHSVQVQPHPLLNDAKAVIEVPRWHRAADNRPWTEVVVEPTLADDNGALFALSVPGDSSVVVAIYVHVVRIQ